MKLKHIIILQNKIDLVRESQAKEQYQQIKKFVEGMVQYRPQVTYHSLASSECSQHSRVTRAYSFDAALASQMKYCKRVTLASLAY